MLVLRTKRLDECALRIECSLTTTRRIYMKTRISKLRLMAALGAISLSGIAAGLAEEPAVVVQPQPESASPSVTIEGSATVTAPSDSSVAVVKETPAPKLPYGVADVLKLSQAQVSENIVLSYIQNSGTYYDLRPNDIVYLKQQGVSDAVVNAMMDQRKKALDAAAQAQAVAAANAPVPQESLGDASTAVTAPLTPTYSQPVCPEPAYAPSSSLYVIPSPAVSYAYYGGSPYYYYSYYGAPYRYYGPSVVFRFGGGRSFGHSFGFRGGHSFHHR